MNNLPYTTVKYSVTIQVAQSPKEVFYHIVNDVSKFWPEEFEGQCSNLNDEFVFSTGDSHYSKNKVVELVPEKKLVWLVTGSIRKTDGFDWTGTKMIFELSTSAGNTVVMFTYDGLVLENEFDRLVEVCDMVIKKNLYNLLTGGQAR